MLQHYFRPFHRLPIFLLFLLISLLFGGCIDQPQATPAAQNIGVPGGKARTASSLPESTAAPGLPSPTPAPMPPTVTALSSPSVVASEARPLPTPLATLSPTASQTPASSATAAPVTSPTAGSGVADDEGAGDTSLQGAGGLKLEDLPRRNGLPQLPVSTPAPSRQQAGPNQKANYGASGNSKVGIQAGHWLMEAVPEELARLRDQTGGSGGGVREVDVTLDLSRRVAKILRDRGIEVDLLPATVPVGYTADAFVSIHADSSPSAASNGYKLARSRFSAIPNTDDQLLSRLQTSYGAASGQRLDGNITRNMTGYYAFNSRRRSHAISGVTPGVILETGYLTNVADRTLLITRQDALAGAIADGITQFLNNRPPLDLREKPAQTVLGVEVSKDDTPILGEPGGAPIAYVAKGQRFEYYETRGDYYAVWLPVLNKPGYLRRADATSIVLPR